jgi:formate/nitrite transporter FocA (FNT family)
MNSMEKLLLLIGHIDDLFLEESEAAIMAHAKAGRTQVRKRAIKYTTLAAAASLGIAATYLLIRSKRASTKTTATKLLKSA